MAVNMKNQVQLDNGLKNITSEQFAQLGGNVVAYITKMGGEMAGKITNNQAIFDRKQTYCAVVGATGDVLMIADSEEVVAEWMVSESIALATRH